MKTYNIGDTVKINGKTGTITQIFEGDDVTTYEITFKNGTTIIECL